MSGVTYAIRRLLQAFITVSVLSILVFLSLHMAPGDPAIMIAGIDAPERVLVAVRERHGLDLPLHVQYVRWISGMAQGDFGTSYRTNRPLADDLWSGFRVSLTLGAASLAFAMLVGIPLGLIAGIKRGTTVDFSVMFLAGVGMSIPGFWLAIMLTLLFSLHLGWLPSGGWGTWQQMIMPAISLSSSTIALLARLTRSLIVEILLEDYVRTARAKGLAEAVVLNKHALRNAVIPVVTVIALAARILFSGALITESIFAWPGMGRLFWDSVTKRDYPVLMGILMITAVLVIVFNLLCDFLYVVIDPRIQYD